SVDRRCAPHREHPGRLAVGCFRVDRHLSCWRRPFGFCSPHHGHPHEGTTTPAQLMMHRWSGPRVANAHGGCSFGGAIRIFATVGVSMHPRGTKRFPSFGIQPWGSGVRGEEMNPGWSPVHERAIIFDQQTASAHVVTWQKSPTERKRPSKGTATSLLLRLLYWIYERRLLHQLKQRPTPRHVGIILDGNRRHARKRGVSDPCEIY